MARPTVNDIAKAAGVSLATVDRVLNARPGVTEKTVHRVNARDYSPEQIAVWAPAAPDMALWSQRIQAMNATVCVSGETIIGYAGLLESGYVDHFYVHHQWQGRGIGTELFKALLAEAREKGVQELSSDVSITAKPFFQSLGFHVVQQQEVVRNRVALTNFKMAKRLSVG